MNDNNEKYKIELSNEKYEDVEKLKQEYYKKLENMTKDELEEDFVRLNIRYIAIMDNIDTNEGLNDFLPIQDWFNEMHAKNTSQKVRAVMKNKGNSGIPLTTNHPYRYKKDENDKTKWIIDEPVAKIIKRIFSSFIQGSTPSQIAKKFTEEGIMNSTEYHQSLGMKTQNPLSKVKHYWYPITVTKILDR